MSSTSAAMAPGVGRGKQSHRTTVEQGHDRFDLAIESALHQSEQVLRAFDVIDVGVGLVDDDDVTGVEDRSIDMGMEIQFHADPHLRSHQVTNSCNEIAFAVIVTLGDHGAMERQQNGVDGTRSPQIVKDAIPHEFIGRTGCNPCGLGPRRGVLRRPPIPPPVPVPPIFAELRCWVTRGASSIPRSAHMCRLKFSILVGNSANVLVSVPRDATKIRICKSLSRR